MIYIPFWLSMITTFLLFISWAVFSHNTGSVRIISSWWLGFHLFTFLIPIAGVYKIDIIPKSQLIDG